MNFRYKAIKDSKTVTGSIDADNQDNAIMYLKSNNLIVLDISTSSKPFISDINSLFSKVSFNDIVDFTRQLSIMLNSGLTIIDSIDILKKQIDKPAYRKMITKMDEDIRAGNSLSSSLLKNKKNFNNLYIALVRAGEASGKLDQILSKLSTNLEQQRAFRGKIKGAMIYPMIVITAMLGVVFVMLTVVIPQLTGIYKDFGIELPMSTRVLMGSSEFMQKFWPVVLLTFFGVFTAFSRYYRSKVGRNTIDQFMLRLPIFSKIIKVSALVDTTRTLSVLIGAGVSILDSLDIVKETTSNIVYQNAITQIRQDIEKGGTFGRALEEAKLFPPIFVQMATVGEQTGHLDETLEHLAVYFESESELAVKALTTLIEPAILIVLAVGVIFLVMAVLTPIFSLSTVF